MSFMHRPSYHVGVSAMQKHSYDFRITYSHLQHILISTNSRAKLSISPLIRYVADLVSFLCFLLCVLLQFRTILMKRASGLSLGTFYHNGALSRHFSHDFPCSPTLLLLFLPSHSYCSVCRCVDASPV